MRIVVIDDEGDAADMMAAQLCLAGHEAVAATSGKDGIALAMSGGADAVVTDMLMPAMDGIEVIRELRRVLPQTWIVATSGGGSRISSDMALNFSRVIGADRILYKPFSRNELLTAIGEAERPG